MDAYWPHRREHPRFIVELPFDYCHMEREEEHGGFTKNASQGGLLVRLSEFMEKGALLIIVIPFIKGLEYNTIKGMAKVVWGEFVDKVAWGKYCYGLEFQSLTKGSLDTLKILLNEPYPKRISS